MNRLTIIALIYVLILVAAWVVTRNDTMIQTIAVALTGLVVIWYTYETYLLRTETQKQTELTQRPLVLAEIKDDQFSVINYGQGVALNVIIMPVVVSEEEQVLIKFKDTVTILKPHKTKSIGAESFHRGISKGDFFVAHLDPQYATQDLILEVHYQNAELRTYSSREKISPKKREILEFTTRET